MISAIGSALPRLSPSAVDGAMTTSRAGAGATVQTQPMDFASVLSEVAMEAVGTLKNAETVSLQGVKGQASTQAVVDAVMSAERTLQTAVTIRDKVVSAYLDLSRMAI